MSDGPLGSLCIVLHGHLPYVLHHGTHPHGEAWLHEGAAEAYLPLLETLDEFARSGTSPGLTLGLTPVLLEQLAHPHFKAGFVAYLNERIARAALDRKEFEANRQRHFAGLAARWEAWYAGRWQHFERIGQDIPGAFAAHARAGRVQLLTSSATHAYLPLLLNDQCLRAQLAAGTFTTRRHTGLDCRGMWLPECAYRPTWPAWVPWVLYGDPRFRPGLETFMAGAGVTHFFVDTHLVTEAQPLGTMDGGTFHPAAEGQTLWDAGRAWGSPLEPVGVASETRRPDVFALARHPQVSAKVWSAVVGYPGAGEYLEFHRKHGDERGLRYHRITDTGLPLDLKQAYLPESTSAKVREHAAHFCQTVRDTLRGHKETTGRPGVCVAPFDAELFGHWWFEGPSFLRSVLQTLSEDQSVELLTAEQVLERHPPDKVVRLPEGSWGAGGKHDPWLNDHSRWMWEVEYRAEGRLLKLLYELPWRAKPEVAQMLQRTARELLLLQASDWPFVIYSKGAVDYGVQRFALHATRFDRLGTLAEDLAAGRTVTPIQQVELDEADAHDNVFPDIDLSWWE